MADTKKLNKLIDESGLKRGYVAEQIGITQNSLVNKISGITDFKVTEAQALCRILSITDPTEMVSIFFNS